MRQWLQYAVALTLLIVPGMAQAQLPTEPFSVSETLPKTYPTHWVFAHDMAFYSIASGRFYIVDPKAKDRDVHGIVDAAQMAAFSYAPKRGEFYVAETFYSHGMRGDRSDHLTIYDTETLNISAQIELPGAKRFMSVPQPNALQQTWNGKFLLIFNFTPAASVTVLDLDRREIINEIQIPGCMLVYPHGDAGFASHCGDGSMIAFELDEAGEPVQEYRTEPFNDIDDDPLFMKTAYIGRTAYFVSFKGAVQAVDLSGGEPVVGERSFLRGDVRLSAHGEHARPAGWQIIADNGGGRFFVLMRPDAQDGDHKFGGSYVWVFDPKADKVTQEIALNENSIAIEATGGRNPVLVATNDSMGMDVYDLKSGEWLRTIGGWGAATPFALHAAQ